MTKFQITIDREECISCGACWEECGEVFAESDDGLTEVTVGYLMQDDPARGLVPANLEPCVRAAADSCPVEIIHLAAVA